MNINFVIDIVPNSEIIFLNDSYHIKFQNENK